MVLTSMSVKEKNTTKVFQNSQCRGLQCGAKLEVEKWRATHKRRMRGGAGWRCYGG